jgi:hypothetical protein
MHNPKIIILTAAVFAAFASTSFAQDAAPKSGTTTNTRAGTNAVARVQVKQSQSDVASKTAKFDMISKTDTSYKTALDAHALDDAHKQANKDGAFKGKVTQIYEPRGGSLAIVNFDTNYHNALTALLRKSDFKSFPVLTNLIGKEVVVSGKFIEYQGREEIVLTNTAQVKLVE